MSKFVNILKVVPENMATQNGFVWPEKGPVECPDWDPKPVCGRGLHGWRWTPSCDINSSNGYHAYASAKWLVVKVHSSDIVNLDGKVKFRCGTVIYCGVFDGAVRKIQKDKSMAGFLGTATVGDRGTATAGDGGTAKAGDYGTATAGYGGTSTVGDSGTATVGDGGTAKAGEYGTATAGHYGTATVGDGGTATAGEYGTATAGHYGTATAGNRGTATAGHYGTATAGEYGTATAGYGGTATAGHYGTATAGHYGTATAGEYGTATAGNRGTATVGDSGVISILFSDGSKFRRAVAVVGQTLGIEPGKKYRVVNGAFAEVTDEK